MFLRSLAAATLTILMLGVQPASARITSLELAPPEPFAGGASFGEAGAYERVVGKVRGELDPADPRNAGIADIALAPRNAKGMVLYTTDFFMLRPKDAAKGSHTLVYEVLNRGRKFLFNWVLDAPAQAAQAVNDPKSLADAGDALLLKRGDTIVWTGWEADAQRQFGGMAIDVPVATQNGKVNGPAIVATVRDELVSGTRGPLEAPFLLTFHAATPDKDKANLTVRRHEADPAEAVPDSGWIYSDDRHIALLPLGTRPSPGALYEITYEAIGPKVQGIGFAATRDVVASLRGDGMAGRALLGGAIEHTVALGISQSGRFLRDFIHQGFNQDEDGKKVFDGMLGHISGIGGVFLNARFAQPSRTNTQHEDHLFPENAFPFSSATLHDSITGQTGSLLRRDGFDPLLIETNTATEYWQKGASLLTTDTLGTRDVELPPTVRAYLISSSFHYGRPGLSEAKGPCTNPRNTLSPAPVLRALLVDLEDWVAKGVAPPPSRVPRLADGTLVPAEATGFPAIPGFEVAHKVNAVARFGTYVDPIVEAGPQYRVLVPKADAIGNDMPGVRLPDVEVPRATRTGWNFYNAPFPTGELCDRDGSMMALAKTDADKAAGDARPSLSGLYPTAADYAAKVKAAADALVAARLLLPEDAEKSVAAAK
jgi:hypothetical protein